MVGEWARRDAQFLEYRKYSTDCPRLVARHVIGILITQTRLLNGAGLHIFPATAGPVNTRLALQWPRAAMGVSGAL